MEIEKLKEIAKEIRVDIIRMIAEAGSGHPGGSLSQVEILTALFFGDILRYDPKNPYWPERDRLVLSKGHGCPALYAVLAKAGCFPKGELMTLRKVGSRLQGHPDRTRLPYLECSTGSLGQGISVALGMALAAKIDKKDYKVYCVIGDGESQVGQIWEAAMSAPKKRLDNFVVIVDCNQGQNDDGVKNILDIDPVKPKWEAFGWSVEEIDGHDINQALEALQGAKSANSGKPTLIIARTLKGKGVSFMELKWEWHGKAPTKEQAEQAIKEILNSK